MLGGYMMDSAGRQTLETRGRRAAQNLAATLTAAGLDDPDILALAAEADALRLASKLPVKTSRGGMCGDESSYDGSPDSPLIGTTPESPVKSSGAGHRSTSLSPSPGRKPSAASTYAAASRRSSTNDFSHHRTTPQTSNSGYAAAAAAHHRGSSPTPGVSRGGVSGPAAAAATLTRRSSLGSQQQQQQQQYMPPHAVAFGSTVPVASVPSPPSRKLSAELALNPAQLTRRSSLGNQSTHSVAFGSTVKPGGSVSPTRESSAGITRRTSLPSQGLPLSRQNSSSNYSHMMSALTRRSSLGAGGLSRKNSIGAEGPRMAFGSSCARDVSQPVTRDASSSGLRLSVNGRAWSEQHKNSLGGARCASASPTRASRIPGGHSSYSGAAKPANTTQAVASPFAAAANRLLDSPSPRIVHSTFIIDNGIKRTSSLGHRSGACGAEAVAFQAAAAAAAAAAGAGSSRHRRTPSSPVWPPEEDERHDEISDIDHYYHQSPDNHHRDHTTTAAYEYHESGSSGSTGSSSSVTCDPTPAALPVESAEDHQDTSVGHVREDFVTADSELEYVSYGAGEKLPVLTEEQADKEVNSNGGSSAGGGWGNLFMPGRNKTISNAYSGRPRGTISTDSDGSAAAKERENIRIHSSTGEQRTNSSSGSSDRDYFTDQKQQSKKRRNCILWGLAVLVIVSVGAVFGGLYGSKHLGAKKSDDVMAFEITLAAPARAPSQGCSAWFGSSERIGAYQRLVSSAYASALNVPAADTKVNSVTCDGSSVYGTNGASYNPSSGRAARLLLSKDRVESVYGRSLQQMIPAPVPESSSSWIDIKTVISIPAPADLSRRSQILETVSSSSASILAGPISQFLGVQSLMVKSADPVIASASSTRGAQAPSSQPADSPEVLDPESGELLGEEYALPVDTNTAMIPTDTDAADGSSTPALAVVQPQSTVSAPDASAKPSSSASVEPSSSAAKGSSSSQPDTAAAPVPAAAAPPPPAAAEAEAETTVQPPTELQLSTFPWNPIKKVEAYASAPACLFSPTQTNTVTDAHGRLWSLMNNKECAFRPQTDNARIGKVPLTWDTAPVCLEPPTNTNFVLDTSSKMWGWQQGKTCAFRAKYQAAPETVQPLVNAKPLAVPEKISVVWDNAAICPFAPTKTNTVLDAFGRMWSWNSGKSCAFRYSS